jgi:hypothetical protein
VPTTKNDDDPLDRNLEQYYGGTRQTEEECTSEIIDVIHQYIERRFQEGRRPALRDAHAKDTGLVKAFFEVDEDLARDYRQGVFAEPRTYEAWIRFSNGNCEHRSDRWFDARGMAIKLTGVPGKKLLDDEPQAQDFILVNSPAFFVDDLRRYKATLRAFLTPWIIPQLLSALKIREPRKIWLAFKANSSLIENPLNCQYWSTTPYKLGDNMAMKFTAKPRINDRPNLLRRLITILLPGFSLKREMETSLDEERMFDFFIQLYEDKDKTPIEDTTIEWTSSPIHVATITIPPNQKLCSSERNTFCENLSFSPWHCLPEHRPLGAVNRVRRLAYTDNSKHRHELNLARQIEPNDKDWSSL